MIQRSPSWTYTQRKTIIQKDTRTRMFIAAVFTVTKTKNQPKHPLTKEWVGKMWCVCVYTHTHTQNGILFRHKNEVISAAAIWMDLEIIILIEVKSERKKNI